MIAWIHILLCSVHCTVSVHVCRVLNSHYSSTLLVARGGGNVDPQIELIELHRVDIANQSTHSLFGTDLCLPNVARVFKMAINCLFRSLVECLHEIK